MRGPGEDAGALILAGGPYWMSFDNGVRSADGLPELTPARTQLRQDVGYPDIDNYFEVYVNEPARDSEHTGFVSLEPRAHGGSRGRGRGLRAAVPSPVLASKGSI